ncbi:MAG TPA: SMP-30/gluconolactonase/LRE family protein [Polyangia bacterium]|jgi:gluconolactonase
MANDNGNAYKLGSFVLACALVSALSACRSVPPAAPGPATPPAAASGYAVIGSIERLDPALDALVPPDAKIEKLAEGFTWAEGPVWTTEGGGALLFSDVPNNVIHRWKDGEGLTDFLRPGGYTGKEPRGGNLGPNGLTFDGAHRLILCQHGDRRVARLEADRSFATVAGRFEGKRFNSPNDVVLRSNGDVYFTDPPYGFEGAPPSWKRELPFSGVYHRTADGAVKLLTKELSFPNGIAFSPDEKLLYVSNSDPARAIWMVYDVTADGGVANGRLFFDATSLVKAGKKGLPDGLKIDAHGNLFGGGPGGVLVFAPTGKLLGTIVTGEPTANVAFGDDGSVLYMTAHDKLCRVRTSTRMAPAHP